MGCCHSEGASPLSQISDDSLIKCFCFLPPIEFIHVRSVSKQFNKLTSTSNKSIQQYWKNQCIFICNDVLDAVQCNNFNAQNWFDFYVQLQELIVNLLISMRHRITIHTPKAQILNRMYNCNNNDIELTLLPIKLIDFDDTYDADQKYVMPSYYTLTHVSLLLRNQINGKQLVTRLIFSNIYTVDLTIDTFAYINSE